MAKAPQHVLVTGGAGFVGRAIIWRLQQTHPDWTIISYDKILPDFHRTYNPPINISKVTWIEGDITDLPAVEAALAQNKVTVVIHTAGIVPPLAHRYSRRIEPMVHKINFVGTQVMLEASKNSSSVRAFVWTGSVCAVIDDFRFQYPCINETWKTTSSRHSTIYGESKAKAEPLVLQANDSEGLSSGRNGVPFLTTSLRPSTLFGPEDYQLIPGIQACIDKNEMPYIVGDGYNLWDVTDVRNVAHAHVLAVENLLSSNPTAAGEAILFGNGCPIPFRDFCCYIWSHWNAYPRWEVRIHPSVAYVVAGISGFFSSMFGLNTTFSSGSINDALAVRYVDGKKAESILGYKPILGLEEALHESCLEYKKRLESSKVNAQAVVDQAAEGKKIAA